MSFLQQSWRQAVLGIHHELPKGDVRECSEELHYGIGKPKVAQLQDVEPSRKLILPIQMPHGLEPPGADTIQDCR